MMTVVRHTIVVGLLALPRIAAAGSTEFAEGLRLFGELDYEAARPKLAAAKLDESLPAADRAQAAVHLAIIQVSLGDEESARRNMSDAVRLDPTAELPMGTSPALADMLAAAKATVPADLGKAAPVSMQHTGPAPGSTATAVAAEIGGDSADAVDRVVLHFRTPAGPNWRSGDLGRTGARRFEGELPIGAAGAIEYWLEAVREDGSRAATAGSEVLPMRFTAPSPEEETHWYQHWWLWTVVGTVAAGSAVAAVILSQDDSPNPCNAPAGHGCIEVNAR